MKKIFLLILSISMILFSSCNKIETTDLITENNLVDKMVANMTTEYYNWQILENDQCLSVKDDLFLNWISKDSIRIAQVTDTKSGKSLTYTFSENGSKKIWEAYTIVINNKKMEKATRLFERF